MLMLISVIPDMLADDIGGEGKLNTHTHNALVAQQTKRYYLKVAYSSSLEKASSTSSLWPHTLVA